MRLSCALLVVLLGAVSSAQEQASSSASPGTSSSAPHPAQVAILAELSKTVDARKAHSGDPLLARVTQEVRVGDNVVNKGSKLAGHVGKARPLAKREADSVLEMIFESVILKDGRELRLPAFVAAIGAPVTGDTTEDVPDSSAHINDRSGCVPGMESVRAAMGQTNSVSANRPQKLTASRVGVIGMSDLVLTTHQETGGVTSVITSAKRNVKLESGTQLVLRVLAP